MQKVKEFVLGKPVDPKEEARKWKRELSRNIRLIEKDIRSTDSAIKKTQTDIKALLRRNDRANAATLAKELLNTKKYYKRLFADKSRIVHIQHEIDHSLALMRVQGVLQKSTSIMTHMNKLTSASSVAMTMQALAKEMAKLDFIDDIIETALDDSSEEEEDAEREVNAILDEINLDLLGRLPAMNRPQAASRVLNKGTTTNTPAEKAESGQ